MVFMKHMWLYFGWLAVTIMVHNEVEAWTYHYRTDSNMDWETARRWCQQDYTDMVAIQNKEEIAYLNNTLPYHPQYYWIGIRKVEGQWTWVGTKKPLTKEAANWATKEPNNQGSGEDCVEIYIKRGKDTAMWNDERCSKKKAPLCYKASCFNTSCSEHAECVENIGSYVCKCDPGFTGPRCEEAVQCRPLRQPVQGFLQCNHVYKEFQFSSSCHFHCARGYTLIGSQNLHCLESGDWSSDPPECQAVQCPPITVATGGWSMNCSHPINTNSYNSTCTFSCKEGFELVGSLNTQCDHTGQWTHKTPTCTAVSCSSLLIPAKGHMTCDDPLGNFSFRSTCTVSCEEGYELRGENRITCLKTGNWSAYTPTCEVLRCSPLKSVPHGSLHCMDPVKEFSYGSTCWMECDLGFQLTRTNFTQCTSQGKWSQSLSVCEAAQCSPISGDSSGWSLNCSHPISTNSYNSTCTFSCEEGFELRGSNTTQCDHTGQWTHKTPTCTAVTCKPLVTPVSSTVSCADPLGKFSFRSSCTVSCEEGYTLRGANTLTCLKTGNWTAEPPTCEAVSCGSLPTLANSHMTCADPLGKFSFRSSCVVTCEEGYTLRGENVLTCMETSNWSADTPTCEARQCPLLLYPENGRMTCSHLHSFFSFGSRCSFGCEDGYVLTGAPTLDCTATGSWSQEVPSCNAVQCEPLAHSRLPQSHASPVPFMNCSHPRGNFSFGSQCVFQCSDGYRLNGSNELVCTSAGIWTDFLPTCVAVQCEPLAHSPLPQSHAPPVPFMNCSHPRGNFSFGSQCVFQCSDGYRLNGSNELVCTSAGIWTDLLPTCVVKEMPLGTSLLVYIATGAALSIGLLMVGGLFLLLVHQFTKKAKFTPDNSAWDGSLNPAFEDI
ncbi:P-selectin [Colossoma macropomum]|uniref:P-selectin n=1 Tax=Colossoma macropomum TaxID=42526 RepID=UPI001864DDD4|nr:P-selectin [Colossoma macropomum]